MAYSNFGPGWNKIVNDCIAELEQSGWTGEIEQIKQKWGSLTIYISPYSDENARIIGKYVKIAAVTCESCGAVGSNEEEPCKFPRCEEHKY